MPGKKRKKRSRLVKVLYAVLIAFAVVAFWRGVWGILDLYLFPNNYLVSCLISILAGLLILYFTKHLFDELM